MNDLTHFHQVNPSDLVITSQSFGLLRKALFENIGKEKAKRFLLRFGKELGINKAKEIMEHQHSIEYLLSIATKIHINLGHVSAVELDGSSLFIENGEYKIKSITGKWIDSFEVSLHLEHHGMADECSCYMLNGYASGYLSTVYDRDIFVKELSCRSKGDADCIFEVNTREYWQLNSKDDLAIYDDQTILNELENTYDELLFKNNLLGKITKYHDQLTDCVARKNNIEDVVRTAYEILNIPIVIEDLYGNIMLLHGMELVIYQKFILKNKKKKISVDKYNKTTHENIGQTYLLTTPIYLENKIFATCSFIYLEPQVTDENDYLFLERLSNLLSLCFLNEKISFETTERLRISILDRLINKQYSSLTEVTSQLKYVAPNIDEPFVTLSIKCESKKMNRPPIDLYDQLLQLSKVLKFYYIDAFLSQYKDEIVVLVFSVRDQPSFLKKLKQVMADIEKVNKDIDYKVGVSRLFDNLTHFQDSLKQAEQAVGLPRKQKIIQFDELGLLGMLLQNMDVQNIKEIAKKEFGILLDSEAKYRELLHTLYIYLVNGGRFEKTMRDLSLSLGGIQYRIRKIESIIQKDLKDFSNNSYLLLLIESLILVGEISI